jgi:hypothetical protein
VIPWLGRQPALASSCLEQRFQIACRGGTNVSDTFEVGVLLPGGCAETRRALSPARCS